MEQQVFCKLCGSAFTLTEKQLQYYADKGLNTPTHCNSCIELKKQEKEDPYYGLYEAMANYMPLKKRRQRVHYRPHIVLGFR